MKTKAEQSFAEHFAAVAKALPGDAAQLQAREAAMARFDELGLPHRRIEAWKYTDLRNALGAVAAPAAGDAPRISLAELNEALGPLAAVDSYRAVFVNGRMNDELSSLPSIAGVTIGDGGRGTRLDGPLANEAIAVLNQAFATGGLDINVEDGTVFDKPLMIVSARAGGDDLLVTTRHEVHVRNGASLTLIEAAVSLGGTHGQANVLVNVTVDGGGHLDHIKIGGGAHVTDLATWRVELGAEARYRVVQLIPGAPLARNQVFVTFEGESAELDFASAVLGNGNDHIDSTIVVDHRAPGCISRELFKGVLDDRARGVCQGKVIVQQIAQKTDGKQMAQALMLSEDAEFDSKPELEIYADDVACGHGSTSAEIDPDLVFYCRSRGIPEDQAKVLLTESFVAEAIDKVEHDALRDALSQIARDWLARNHANK
jgi:Fe-S cluster assembly protein SufD